MLMLTDGRHAIEQRRESDILKSVRLRDEFAISSHSTRPAALPWYNFPSTQSTLDSVWEAVAAHLKRGGFDDIPRHLDHTTSHHELFGVPSLVLSQCCGPELFLEHARGVIPVAAPVISAYHVAPGHYFSYIVSKDPVNLDKPRVVVNSRSSHSGYTAARRWLRRQGIEDYSIRETGSHSQSARELQAGHADLAAIDALSWRFLDATRLQILDTSEPVPAPPFIMGPESDIPRELLLSALNEGFRLHGKATGITGAVAVTKDDYRSLAIS